MNKEKIKVLEKKMYEKEKMLKNGYHSPTILRNEVIDIKIQIVQLKLNGGMSKWN